MAPLRSMGNIGNMYSPYEDVFASTGKDTQSPYPNMNNQVLDHNQKEII